MNKKINLETKHTPNNHNIITQTSTYANDNDQENTSEIKKTNKTSIANNR